MLTGTTSFQKNLWPRGSWHVFNALQEDGIEASWEDRTEAAVAHSTRGVRMPHMPHVYVTLRSKAHLAAPVICLHSIFHLLRRHHRHN